MAFKKGQSGNENGRPKGAKNKSTILFQQILEDNREKLINKAIELAESGEVSVLNKLLDKILPTLAHNKNENSEDITALEEKLQQVLKRANELITPEKD